MLRRGFKTQAERISSSVREELGLAAVDRLDCNVLAERLAIPIVTVAEPRSSGAQETSIRHLLKDAAGFSALTVCVGRARLIVYNDRHPPGRRANSLAHELSHSILEHPPAPAIGAGGCRRWDAVLEAEADWLAATLLVPRDGAFQFLRSGRSQEDGAAYFGVSLALFRWRANQTGIMRQLAAGPHWHRIQSRKNELP
ncbi:MAG: ImmA/IrrE family metallo-endopeptidase [Pirellulales bacterium]